MRSAFATPGFSHNFSPSFPFLPLLSFLFFLFFLLLFSSFSFSPFYFSGLDSIHAVTGGSLELVMLEDVCGSNSIL